MFADEDYLTPIPDPDLYWLQRWHAVRTTIDECVSDPSDEVSKEFCCLLQKLNDFGSKQFLYFFFGFHHRFLEQLHKVNPNKQKSGDKHPFPGLRIENRKSFTVEMAIKSTFLKDIKDIPSGLDLQVLEDKQNRLVLKGLRVIGCVENGDSSDLKKVPQKLAKDYDFQPDYVLRATLDQILFDFEIIKRAFHERKWGTSQDTLDNADAWGHGLVDKVKGYQVTLPIPNRINNFPSLPSFIVRNDLEEKNELQLEDLKQSPTNNRLILSEHINSISISQMELLKQFVHIDRLLPQVPRVITYFNRSPQIRVIPYARVSLVGIPVNTSENRLDLLSMCHELGHYIYWHGVIKGIPVREYIANVMRPAEPYLRNWSEEIFSDIMGTLLYEKEDIFSWILAMISDNSASHYVQDNRIHPIDAIRPYIFLETISFIRKYTKQKREQSRGHVETQENEYNQKEEPKTFYDKKAIKKIKEIQKRAGGFESFWIRDRFGQNKLVKFKQARKHLQPIIRRICFDLIGVGAGRNWEIKSENKEVEEKKTTMSDRNTAFDKSFVASAQLATLEQRPIRGKSVQGKCESDTDKFFIELREQEWKTYRALNSRIWRIIFEADGWVTKGPENQPTGGAEPDWNYIPTDL